MSKIPHYMVELKKRNMENSTFLCKFICVQPITRLFCTILQAMYDFSSLSTILFLIHFIYLNLSHNQCINNIFIYLHIFFLAVIVKLSKQKLDNLYCFDFSTAKKESQSR